MTHIERRLRELRQMQRRQNADIDALVNWTAQLARDLLFFAASGDMPESYWQTDTKVGRACKVLGWTREQGRRYAQRRWDKS